MARQIPLIWSQNDGDFIIDEFETASNVNSSIVVTVPPPDPLLLESLDEDPVSLNWSVDTPLPSMISITTTRLTLNVHLDSLLGSFPMVELTYLISNNPMKYGTITQWEDLPANATEIVTYKPYPSGSKQWVLTVTPNTNDESRSFIIRIKANYDTGRANLIKAIEDRRQTNAKS